MNYTIEILEPIFKEANYRFMKTKKTWVKKNDNISVVCQYQKSRFSNNFFINIGIHFGRENDNPKKSISLDDCHLIARYDQVFQDFSALDIKEENFENYEILNKELAFMTNNLEKKLIPILDNMLDIDFMKLNLNNYPNEHWWLQNITEENYYMLVGDE